MNTMRIESRENARIKLARKVRDGRDDDRIFVEGVRLAEEAIRSGIEVEFALCRKDFDKAGRNADLREALTAPVFEISDALFSDLAETKQSQGIILICGGLACGLDTFENRIRHTPTTIPHIVMLEEANNPSNLGAVVRTAEAAGAAGVIVSRDSTGVFSPKSLRASMGSAFRLPIWTHATSFDVRNFADKGGYMVTASDAGAGTSHFDADWTTRQIIVFGSEAHGISSQTQEILDGRVKVLMNMKVESLNLAVAAGVILFEARRQLMFEK